MRLLLRQGLRHHRKKPLQTLLTLCGIAAGVALSSAMRLSQGTAERAFDQAVTAVAGTATHTVTAGPDGIPVADYAALRRALGGRCVAPSVQAIARVPERAERTVLRVLGIDPFADQELRPWSSSGAGDLPVARLVTESGGFVATAPLAQRLGIAPGASLAITVGGRPFAAKCLGTFAPPPQVAAGLADTLLVDVATAQEWTGRLDRVDRLDLRLGDGALPRGLTLEGALARVRAICGPGVRIETAGASQRSLAQLTRGFRINVTALCLLSLLVGAFLVHETMRLSVVARRPAFGVLRALGVAGSALGAVVALESLVLGLAGSGAGALLGALAAEFLLAPIVRTLNDHYATFAAPALSIDPAELALAAGIGTAVTVLAGLGPAIAASRVSPREVLVPAAGGGGVRAWRWWWCLPPALLGAGLLSTVGTRLVQGYLGMLALLLAAVALTPTLLQAVLRGFAALLHGLGPFARYAVRSTAAAKDTLALPVAAMVLAVATTIGMAVLVTSFRDSVGGWLGQVLPGDVYVSVPGGVEERGQPIEPAIVAALQRAPGVAACTTYHRVVVPLAGGSGRGEVEVVGVDASPAFRDGWPLLAGNDASGRAALANDGAWVSEPLAFRWGLAPGDTLTMTTAHGDVPLRIAATYRDYSNERGEVIVGTDLLRRHVAALVTALGLEAAPGADVPALVATLRARAAAAGEQGVQVRSQVDLRTTSLEIFDRTFAITGVMRLLCLVVAFFGIWSAFASLQLERAGEVGLLRCLGAMPSRIGVVVVGQTALLGASAALLAAPLGIGIGQLLAHVINKVSFGWSLVAVTVPGRALVEASLLAVVASLLAGIWPAVRFARMRPAAALREG